MKRIRIYVEWTDRNGETQSGTFEVKGGLGRIAMRLWMIDEARLTCDDGTMYVWQHGKLIRA